MNPLISWWGNACWWGQKGHDVLIECQNHSPQDPETEKEKKTSEGILGLIEVYTCRMHVQSFGGVQSLYSGVIIVPVTKEKWPACNFYFILFLQKATNYTLLFGHSIENLCTTHLFSKYLELTALECNAQMDNSDLWPQRHNEPIVIQSDTSYWFLVFR